MRYAHLLMILVVNVGVLYSQSYDTITPFEHDGLYGYVETNTWQIVIEPQYLHAMPFRSNGLAIVWATEDIPSRHRGQIIDTSGEPVFTWPGVIKHVWSNLYYISTGNLGFILYDVRTGEPVVTHLGEFPGTVTELPIPGRFAAPDDSSARYFDENGKTVLENENWINVGPFVDGRAVVVVRPDDGGRLHNAIIDRDGNVIRSEDWTLCKQFSEGLCRVLDPLDDEPPGYVDTEGSYVFTLPSVRMAGGLSRHPGHPFENGVASAPVSRNPFRWVVINREGEHVSEILDVTRLHDFSNGYALMEASDGDGFVDANGQSVTGTIFDDADSFNESGVARVKLNGRDALFTSNHELVWSEDIMAGRAEPIPLREVLRDE